MQTDVGTLIVQRVLGVDAYESAHRIPSVERALWSAQDIYALHVAQVEVVGALIHPWDVIYIQPHGRSVDAASHSAHVYRSGLTAAV